jgi:hypothetical protein
LYFIPISPLLVAAAAPERQDGQRDAAFYRLQGPHRLPDLVTVAIHGEPKRVNYVTVFDVHHALTYCGAVAFQKVMGGWPGL